MGDTRLDRLWWGPLASLPWWEQTRISELVRRRQPVKDHPQAELAVAFARHSGHKATWMAGVLLVLGLALLIVSVSDNSSAHLGFFAEAGASLISGLVWAVRAWRIHRFEVLVTTTVGES